MRVRIGIVQLCVVVMVLLSGCGFDVAGPTYTQDSIVSTLKQYGITAHYPRAQGNGALLSKATGERYLLQIDFIDQYEVKSGWVEVYLYQDPQKAYEEALQIRKDFEKRFRYDQKIADMSGTKLEEEPIPLFQHGNVILFGAGIVDQKNTLDRIMKTFGQLQEKQK